ncbi:MAG: DUF4112 domain-containing protein [Candidatus Hydrogenedentales bacterium]
MSEPIQLERVIPTTKEREDILRQVRALADLLDSKFAIPGTNFRFGLDPILGLIPGVGDAVSMALSAYIISQAQRLGLPRHVMARMVLNVLIDGLIGSIPLVGDVFDVLFKANRRNLKLLGIPPKHPNDIIE